VDLLWCRLSTPDLSRHRTSRQGKFTSAGRAFIGRNNGFHGAESHDRGIIEYVLVTWSLPVADHTKGMNENYDFNGRVHRLKQRKPCQFSLVHLPNHEAFDVEFSRTGQVLQQTDYTNALEVYRSTRWVYDDSDRLIRTLEFDAAGTQRAVSEFEYSNERRAWTTRNSIGIVTSRGVEEYRGTVLTLLATYDATGKPKRLKFFEYTGGKLSQTVSKYFGADGGIAALSISRFDAMGRVIEAFGLKPDGSPNGDGRYTYEYDREGRKRRVLSYNDLDRTEIPNIASEFAYQSDDQGNWTERTQYQTSRGNSGSTTQITTREFTYFGLVNRK
jgi:hypothetical protein